MFAIMRRYNPQDRWGSLSFGINTKLELQKKMTTYVSNGEDCFLQIRKSGTVISTYQVTKGKTLKVTDTHLIEDHK